MYRNFPVFFHALMFVMVDQRWIQVLQLWPYCPAINGSCWYMQNGTEEFCGCAKFFEVSLTLATFAIPMSLCACLYLSSFFKNVSLLFLPGPSVKMVSPPLAVWNIATVWMCRLRQWLVMTWRRAGGGPQGLRGQTRGLRPLLPHRVKCPPEGLQT